MKKRSPKQPSFIAPERLYSLRGFQECAGISGTRMRQARLRGIAPRVLRVGRRQFIRGADGIEFIESLAEGESHRDSA